MTQKTIEWIGQGISVTEAAKRLKIRNTKRSYYSQEEKEAAAEL